MSKIKIAINGFGRIGRQAFKIALTKPELEVVAINDLTEPAVLAQLLRYDSNYGPYEKKVLSDDNKEKANPVTFSTGNIIVEGKKYPIFAEKDPSLLPWKDLNIDVVLESTGRFITTESAGARLRRMRGLLQLLLLALIMSNTKARKLFLMLPAQLIVLRR